MYYDSYEHFYLNLFKPTESTAGLKGLKLTANGCYLNNVQIIRPTVLFTNTYLLYRSTFILLSGQCMLGLFMFL